MTDPTHNEENELVRISQALTREDGTHHMIVCALRSLSPVAVRDITNNDLAITTMDDNRVWTIQPFRAKFGEGEYLNPHRCDSRRRHWVLHYECPQPPQQPNFGDKPENKP